MVLTKTLKVKNNNTYKSLGYISDSEGFTEIKIEDLSSGSNIKILAKCDFCGLEKIVSYYDYNRNCKKLNLFSCGRKCGSNKYKTIFLEKYGVENPLQLDSNKEKIKKTNLEKYGVDNFSKTDQYKEKVKNTNLEKYGVEHVLQNLEMLSKQKQTNLEKYGVEHVLQNPTILDKLKKTTYLKYGNFNFLKTEDYKIKSKQTNLEKYGVDNYNKSELSKKNTIIGQHSNYISYTDNGISLFKCDLNKNHEFLIHKDNFYKRIESNLPLCTICYPINDQKSIKEKILLEYIKSIYSKEVISGYRDGLEIDIYLPDLNLGIEFNGLYWHSDKFKETNYHINKLNFFKEKGIDIKFIYEDDFDNKLDIIKSQINNWLNLTKTKIYARKCLIKEIVLTEEYQNFLNKNHIQGYVPSKLVYGLYYQNELVSLMCFDKKEGRLNMEEGGWNLSRFCNLLNHQVIGGASKLLNYFIEKNKPSRIISYADKDWSYGNLYFTLGFKLISESKPDYKYIIDGVRKSKQNFTKSKLEKLGYDISLTEKQITVSLNINRIYDCGKMKFEKIFYIF